MVATQLTHMDTKGPTVHCIYQFWALSAWHGGLSTSRWTPPSIAYLRVHRFVAFSTQTEKKKALCRCARPKFDVDG